MEDIFFDVKVRLDEYTDTIFLDYERETILLEVHKDYLDEILKTIKSSYLDLEVVFQKEIKKDILTLVICVPQIIDVFDE